MHRAESRPDLVSAMLEPGFYPDPPDAVELRETHTSWVFLAGELAYKVKKPVTFPFLDYGTVERRREMCREEVRLNRRLAPRIYLRVVGIARSGTRHVIVPDEDPGAIEYAVEMRRVEEARSLESLAGESKLEPHHVGAIAGLLARFHAEAPLAPRARRAVDVLLEPVWENLETLREEGAVELGEEGISAAEGYTRGFVRARRDQMEARARDSRVRDCHGDLRAEHAIVPEGEDPYVYDCVEFNPSLREIDVSADLAFLVMDLTRLGEEELALRLVGEYRDAGGEVGDDSLLSFHAVYRAWVRSKVALLRAGELESRDPRRARAVAEARDLFRLGRRFAWRSRRPLAVVICGVAATGKTTLARELAGLTGLVHLSSDPTRKRLAGLEPDERGSDALYTEELTRRTYRELGLGARRELERGGGAIVDATFHRRSERSAFREGLGDAAGAVLFVECRLPTETLLGRVRGRQAVPDRISDADAEIVERQLAEFEPLDEVPEGGRAVLTTDLLVDRLTVEVERLVDARLWGGAP